MIQDSKIAPMPNIHVWGDQVLRILDEKDVNKLFKESPQTRILCKVGSPLACSLCISWSLFARIIACPCQVIFNGCAFMCSNNNLTNPTDKLIVDFCNELDKPKEIQRINVHVLKTDQDYAMSVMNSISKRFKKQNDVYTKLDYKACEIVMASLGCDSAIPYTVDLNLDLLRLKLRNLP